MHGDPAGLESADTGGESDPLRSRRAALSVFQQAAKAACDIGEHKLQREAEDAAARCVSFIEERQAAEARERLRSGEGLHGEDPKAA